MFYKGVDNDEFVGRNLVLCKTGKGKAFQSVSEYLFL